MVLYLRANIDCVPKPVNIPVLETCARGPGQHPCVPQRLRTLEDIRQSIALTTSLVAISGDLDEEGDIALDEEDNIDTYPLQD